MIYRFIVGILLALWPAISVLADDGTVWSKIVTDDGQHIGFTYRSVKLDDGQKITTQYSQMKIREHESKTRVYVTKTTYFRNNENGLIDRIERESGYRGFRKKLTFERDGNTARLTLESPERTITKEITLTDRTAIDNGASLIKNFDFSDGSPLIFESLNLSAMKVETNHVELAPIQSPVPHVLSLVRKTFDDGQLRSVVPFGVNKETRETLTYEIDLLNRKILYIQTDKKDAKGGTRSFSVIRSSQIPSPHIIKRASLNGNIRYRFSYKDDIRFDIPISGEQTVVTADNFVVLDICETCGKSETLSPEDLKPYLSPSTWIESDDPEIIKLASKVDKDTMSDDEKMRQLGRFTRHRIRNIDFMGHYSASDAMERRKGDCGEDAVLLAALGRAAGIPTRVASGLVYSRSEYHGQSNVFLPHIWAQAYIDGSWKTYDISLGGFDSSFILTSVGHGDPRSISASIQLAKRLKWEEMVHVTDETPK